MSSTENRIAIVDLAHHSVDYARPSTRTLEAFIGGRGLGAAILHRHDSRSEPLSPDGLLCTGASPGPVYLHVRGEIISIHPARALWGKGAVETTVALQAAHPNARVLAIGPASEAEVPIATVINDKGRASGVRNGVGAVWGSKRLRAARLAGRPRCSGAEGGTGQHRRGALSHARARKHVGNAGAPAQRVRSFGARDRHRASVS
jgi:aldehyde:ferredoxin oxidoreductase